MSDPGEGDGVLPPRPTRAKTRRRTPSSTAFPRKVVHIDDGAIAALGRLYGEILPAAAGLLDP